MDISTINIPDLRSKEVSNASRLSREAEALSANAKSGKIDSRLFDVCKDFEALFIKQMLDVMRKTVKKEGIIEGGFAEDIFEDMLYDEYSKKMATTARFGIADTIYNQYSRFVE